MKPIHRGPHRTIVAYLACVSCARWFGLTSRQVAALLAPHYFTCPYCHQGRTRASATVRGYPDRAAPNPPRLDTSLP